jgi:hypothetical protein
VRFDDGGLELLGDDEPSGMPPIELLDEVDESELELEGVPDPEGEDDKFELELDGIPNPEDEDEGDEFELELDGIPNPEDEGEGDEFELELGGGVSPLGRFMPAGGWPVAPAFGGVAKLPPELLDPCEPLSDPAVWPG